MHACTSLVSGVHELEKYELLFIRSWSLYYTKRVLTVYSANSYEKTMGQLNYGYNCILYFEKNYIFHNL